MRKGGQEWYAESGAVVIHDWTESEMRLLGLTTMNYSAGCFGLSGLSHSILGHSWEENTASINFKFSHNA